jgi:hypothetical protein
MRRPSGDRGSADFIRCRIVRVANSVSHADQNKTALDVTIVRSVYFGLIMGRDTGCVPPLQVRPF